MRYYIATQVVELINSESDAAFPLETGGILIGELKGDCFQITHATKPGSGAKHGLFSFSRDGEYSQQVLDEIVSSGELSIDYIGEWHSHPFPVGPSSLDYQSIRWIAQNPRYAVEHPILLIAMKKRNRWNLSVYIFEDNVLQLLEPCYDKGQVRS